MCHTCPSVADFELCEPVKKNYPVLRTLVPRPTSQVSPTTYFQTFLSLCPQIAFIWPLFSKSPLLAVRYLRSTHAMTTNLWNLFLINQKEMKNQHCVLSQLMFWFWTTMVCFIKATIAIEWCGRILGGTVRYLRIYFNTNFFILWLHFQLAPWCSCRTEGGEIFTNHKKPCLQYMALGKCWWHWKKVVIGAMANAL